MFVDPSAIVAILLDEPEAARLASVLSTKPLHTSPVAIFESATALMRVKNFGSDEAEALIREFLRLANIQIIAVTDDMATRALEAYEGFGKGRGHPAQLNMGNCFSYACATANQVPLLAKGEDFIKSDIELVRW